MCSSLYRSLSLISLAIGLTFLKAFFHYASLHQELDQLKQMGEVGRFLQWTNFWHHCQSRQGRPSWVFAWLVALGKLVPSIMLHPIITILIFQIFVALAMFLLNKWKLVQLETFTTWEVPDQHGGDCNAELTVYTSAHHWFAAMLDGAEGRIWSCKG